VARFTFADPTGISGDKGTLTVSSSTAGTYPLDLSIVTCANEIGDNITCTASDGAVTVAVATPTATPAPTAAATPTATAKPPTTLPDTGGAPADGTSTALLLLVAALGAAAVAGGVWAVTRTRRDSL
jgi:hypothetical protein